jgi:hypothetical protein
MDCVRNGNGHWSRVGAEGAKVRRKLLYEGHSHGREGMGCRGRGIDMGRVGAEVAEVRGK